MSNPAHPGRMLFVNMPVADLERSKAFFSKLGFSFNPMFTDETAACMPVGEQAFVMLLGREKFAEFAKLPMADPTTHTLALYCFSVSSRDEVDAVSAAALRRAAPKPMAPKTTASCTHAASSTSTATAGRSCGWTRRQRHRVGGVHGLHAGHRRAGLIDLRAPHVCRRRVVRAAASRLGKIGGQVVVVVGTVCDHD